MHNQFVHTHLIMVGLSLLRSLEVEQQKVEERNSYLTQREDGVGGS